MPDLQRLLARIGLDAAPPVDRAGLRTVHRAYLERVPYETLAIHLDEVAPLDLDVLAARVLADGRGGYCFELNGLLAWMLEALGFAVERRPGRVGARGAGGPTNHLGLVVGVPGEPGRWLADAGLGEGWLDPLPLRAGVHADPGGLGWTLERLPDGWWIGQHPWGSLPGVTLGEPRVELRAFSPHHKRLSRHPDSPFRRALVVQRPLEDRVLTLRARTLSARGPEGEERRVLADADDLAATLRREFSITLAGPRLTRLWSRVAAQHEAWAARGSPPAPA